MKIRDRILGTLLLTGVLFTSFFSGKGFVRATAEKPYGWEKISAYTTYYDKGDAGRCKNISVAASLIDGVTVQPYGDFSFNTTVGKRTAEAGFQQAKIIVNGEYALGVGGGVCQVSTTLYNAAIKAGLTIVEYHPHSLQVGYVSPSRDAMVSSSSDLRLYNPHSFPVYLSVKTTGESVCALFYGKNEGYRYEINTVILEKIAPPIPIVKTGDEEGVIRAPKEGLKSEAYLECYKNGCLLFCKRLRVDEYRPIQGIIGKKITK